MKKVLLVDDHPMIVEGYAMALNKYFSNKSTFVVEKAMTFSDAKRLIDNEVEIKDFFDFAIVDFTLPLQNDSDWKNGGDIVLYLRSVMPACKTIIITGHSEVLLIYEIVKNVRPNGLVNKHEITPDSLVKIVKEVEVNNKYQSKEVKRCIAEIIKKDMMYDDYNRAILVFLSKGYKLIDLDNHIPLSLPTIKKRLAKMKEIFGVNDTASLVQYAIEEGFV